MNGSLHAASAVADGEEEERMEISPSRVCASASNCLFQFMKKAKPNLIGFNETIT